MSPSAAVQEVMALDRDAYAAAKAKNGSRHTQKTEVDRDGDEDIAAALEEDIEDVEDVVEGKGDSASAADEPIDDEKAAVTANESEKSAALQELIDKVIEIEPTEVLKKIIKFDSFRCYRVFSSSTWAAGQNVACVQSQAQQRYKWPQWWRTNSRATQRLRRHCHQTRFQ